MAAWFDGSHELRVLHVELLAIKWGLKLAWGCGLRSVVCETLLGGVSLVQTSSIPSQHLDSEVLLEIKELILRP